MVSTTASTVHGRGPPPTHAVEIWLGAYKPRMLALTGTKADGWLPSMGYAPVEALPPLNATIDGAAEAAGRHPSEIRRLYNLNGRFGRGPGMLEGAPAEWAKQLAELTLSQGISTYILAVDAPDDLRRFATEVAPAVRELVDQARETPESHPEREREHGAVRLGAPAASPFAVVPTPDDGARLSEEAVWDEGGWPTGPVSDPERRYTADQQAAGQHLVDIHDGLRVEIARIRDLIDQVARGTVDPARVQTLINRMTIRQNNWTLGVYCQSYCRAVSGHHTLEDRSVFPHLAQRDARLEPVLRRLEDEHEVIAELLDWIDDALTALVAAEPDATTRLRASVDVLTDAMLSHLSYEERELVEPLATYGYA